MAINIALLGTIIGLAQKVKALFVKPTAPNDDAERAELVRYWNENSGRVSDGTADTGPLK